MKIVFIQEKRKKEKTFTNIEEIKNIRGSRIIENADVNEKL